MKNDLIQAPFELETGGWPIVINGKPRPHGTSKQKRSRAPSDVVAVVHCCERGNYLQYPEEIAVAHATLLAASPVMLSVLRHALDWNRLDIAGINEIVPTLPMLKARRKELLRAINAATVVQS